MTEKIKVLITPSEFGEVRSVEYTEMESAGWSDDPGTGHAILLPDERDHDAYEVVSPLKFAPPIGYRPTPPIAELIAERVAGEIQRLRDLDEMEETESDSNDFDIEDDLPQIETIYEVLAMKADAPPIPKIDPKEELSAKARADLDYWEEIDRQRLLRKRHKESTLKQQAEELAELYPANPKTGSGS